MEEMNAERRVEGTQSTFPILTLPPTHKATARQANASTLYPSTLQHRLRPMNERAHDVTEDDGIIILSGLVVSQR